MNVKNLKAKSVPTHDFGMNPSPEIKRSNFPIRQGNTTAFSFSYLIPLYWYDVLPGDHWNCRLSAACRTAVPIVPILDNWHLDIFAFFTPYRILWDNFVKMMGEQNNPGDSIAYTTPQIECPAGGYAVGSIYDYFGLPTVGQIDPAGQYTHSALPVRAYDLINDEWFRDENLQNNTKPFFNDGPDPYTTYALRKRGKRPDYFTTTLPWPQKGNAAASLPLGSTAPIIPNTSGGIHDGSPRFELAAIPGQILTYNAVNNQVQWSGGSPGSAGNAVWDEPNLLADLSGATSATINQLRTAITLQQLLERDARGGTRYKEMVYSHFRVVSPDARLQRPEYIGGGSIPINVNAVPQTAQTGLTGGTTPLGTLGGTGYAIGTAGFSYAATEHGCIIVIACARADLRYSQGIQRSWSKETRYDFYLPVLDGLGEQAVLNKEIYAQGLAADNNVFGYGPRWDEYRHFPSIITGIMRPTAAGNIAYWHSSQLFGSLPTLNSTFIQDDANVVTRRNFAAGALTEGQQILGDFMVQGSVARSMSTYGVPGLSRL